MNLILYSTHCPKCLVLEKKLQQKNLKYTEVNDVDIMVQKGFVNLPMLEVEGAIMDFKTAVDWVNSQEGE